MMQIVDNEIEWFAMNTLGDVQVSELSWECLERMEGKIAQTSLRPVLYSCDFLYTSLRYTGQ